MQYDKKALLVARLTAPTLLSKLSTLREYIYTPVANFDVVFNCSKEPVAFTLIDELAFKPIKPGKRWGGEFESAWFKLTGTVPEAAEGKKLVAVIDIDSESCVFSDEGVPLQGLTSVVDKIDFFAPMPAKRVVELSDNAKCGDYVKLLVEAGSNGNWGKDPHNAKLRRADLCVENVQAKEFFYDFTTLLAIFMTSVKKRRQELNKVLTAVLKEISKSSKKGAPPPDFVKLAEPLKAELAKTSEGELKDFTFYVTGHAHLDLAWLWPLRETKRKAYRTYTAQLKHIRKYDEYVFGSSQPQQFQWMKDNHPVLYRRIRQEVKDGRIEPQGGLWCESDTNLISGESMIRQVFYGKKFFREEFGKNVRVAWLPDVFGYAAQMPQIFKKCGLDYFYTIKISWNKHTKFPHHSFKWQALDGTSVLAHMPPEGDYNSSNTPLAMIKGYKKYIEKDKAPVAHISFGKGDGGGGPEEANLEILKRLTQEGGVLGMPQVRHGTSIEFFEDLNRYAHKLDTYKGELYLETHQGTYTSQARTKYFNRRIETLFHNVEYIGGIASRYGYLYPKDRLEELWKEVLLYQFHDIIPGSSINRVYKETDERYQIIMQELKLMQKQALTVLADAQERLDRVRAIEEEEYSRRKAEEDERLAKIRAKEQAIAEKERRETERERRRLEAIADKARKAAEAKLEKERKKKEAELEKKRKIAEAEAARKKKLADAKAKAMAASQARINAAKGRSNSAPAVKTRQAEKVSEQVECATDLTDLTEQNTSQALNVEQSINQADPQAGFNSEPIIDVHDVEVIERLEQSDIQAEPEQAKLPEVESEPDEPEDEAPELYAVNASPVVRCEYIKRDEFWYKAELEPYSSGRLSQVKRRDAGKFESYRDKQNRDIVSNGILTVKFSQYGYIVSLTDKEGKEYCGKYMNRLTVYTDKHQHYCSWDLDINYLDKPKDYFEPISHRTILERTCIIRETTYIYKKCKLIQKVILYKDADYLVFETVVDWKARHKNLRANFYPSVFSDKTVCDIQFGNIERSTKTDTEKDWAQFEICAHKWVDVTCQEQNMGVSLLNDCKYGHRVKDGLMSLNLLKAPCYPDKKCDIGTHAFTYVIHPHTGSVFEANTVDIGYAINNPLILTERKVALEIPGAKSSCKNVIVETIKPSEYAEEATILRIYENMGQETVATITTGIPYTRAFETNMVEEGHWGEIDLSELLMQPYEVKTIVLE